MKTRLCDRFVENIDTVLLPNIASYLEMEFPTETTTAIGKTWYDFRSAFQNQLPQNLGSNEQEFCAKRDHEIEAASCSFTENPFTSVHGLKHNEPLNDSSSTNEQNQFANPSTLTSSKVPSCRYSLGPAHAPEGSIAKQGSQPSVDDVHRVPVCSPSNREIWSSPPHKDYLLTQARPAFAKPDNCVLVWCKSALQSTTQMLQNQSTVQLPQNVPRNGHVADHAQNRIQNPLENFTSKMKIPRHVFHPNEALRLQRFDTRNGPALTWSTNNGETLGPLDQRVESRFSPQLSAGTLDPNLVPYFPASAVNMTAQFSPLFEANPPPMIAWQCPPLQTPENEPQRFNSFVPAAMPPRNTPVGYMLDHELNVQMSRGMSGQAPFPLVTRATTPQYPDVKYMFRAANLFMMPNQVTQETKPLYEESPSKINNLSNVQEDTPDQTEAGKLKEAASKGLLQVNEETTHRCNFCQKVYSRHSALKIHMRIHTGERPYSCSVCKRSFAQAGGLESHTRSHTGEKPFKCDVCDRRFSHSTALRNHKRIHTGEKPFKCEHEGCGKAFADQSTLKKHHRIHTGEKPFECPHCSKKFTQLGNMNKHIRCKHSHGTKK